jgi:outer membrane protein assembly factor BamB
MMATGTRAGIVCLSLKTGRVLWSNDFSTKNTANCPDPVYSDGLVFWANGYRKGGICLKLTVTDGKVSAEEAWRTEEMVCHHGGYIVHNGYIYGNHNAGWSCLDMKTGECMWNERAVGKGSLCFADGMLYLFSERGGKAALATCSPEGLTIKGNVTVEGSGTSWAHPVVAGGRLYLRYADNLYCFDVKAE